MTRTPVQSSQISSVGYDHATETLEVEFTTGAVYQYDGVGQATYTNLMTGSEGFGSRFNALIKRGGFQYRKVDG
jgi:hypothetical protein